MAITTTSSGTPNYNNEIVKLFTIATVFWGVVGFTVGVFIALQMAFPVLNIGEYLTFGRLRPVHTSAVIFAFGGNALFATSYFAVQRTCRTRLWGDGFATLTFWGYQLFIVMAALGYVLGITQGKEYAEPEWYVDLWLTVVWVVYLLVFMMTLKNRHEPHIYVANWFFLAFQKADTLS
ncbi:MAG: cbb3-type cytochrome c oxidase subunit I [Rickettsiales bacterium]|nr:cbb3-type cytochrome c oxidase subunit I [Rickettsiales bacterium]